MESHSTYFYFFEKKEKLHPSAIHRSHVHFIEVIK